MNSEFCIKRIKNVFSNSSFRWAIFYKENNRMWYQTDAKEDYKRAVQLLGEYRNHTIPWHTHKQTEFVDKKWREWCIC